MSTNVYYFSLSVDEEFIPEEDSSDEETVGSRGNPTRSRGNLGFAEKLKIIELQCQGKSFTAIGKAVGADRRTVSRVIEWTGRKFLVGHVRAALDKTENSTLPKKSILAIIANASRQARRTFDSNAMLATQLELNCHTIATQLQLEPTAFISAMSHADLLAIRGRRKRLIQLLLDEEDDIDSIVEAIGKDEALFRRRWDSDYMMNLAIDESSVVAEYRMPPAAFLCMAEILSDILRKNEIKQAAVLSLSGSKPVSVMSRIGASLIILAGGRYVEAMRTHGLARSCVYENVYDVCLAIN